MDIYIEELKRKAMYASLDLGPNKFIFDPDNTRWIGRHDAELEFTHAANPQAVLTLIVKIESMQRENVELKSELEEARKEREEILGMLGYAIKQADGWHDESRGGPIEDDPIMDVARITAARQQKGQDKNEKP